MMHSCLYEGQVSHKRYSPAKHQFKYKLFMLYIDLDELPDLFKGYWLWSVNRHNLASFWRKKHLGETNVSLKQSVQELILKKTGKTHTGPVRMLTHLSYFGFGFNPVSFYYCFSADGQTVEFIVAEVNNTPWGEQHCYVMDAATNTGEQNLHRYAAEKEFHVSPFMPMEIQYDWKFSVPDEHFTVHMMNFHSSDKIFEATLALKRKAFNHANLMSVLIRFPAVTIKVMVSIYYQALKLWLKRVPIFDHPVKNT